MLRSLHMKLVLILVLLILAVMLVVGTLMVNRVTVFYMDEFRTQMEEVFDQRFLLQLQAEAGGEGAAERLRDMLSARSTQLGLDSYRQCYVLGEDAAFLAGTDAGDQLDITPNIIRAVGGELGDSLSLTQNYMDIAIPLKTEENGFILYLRDYGTELSEMKWMIFKLTVQVVLFGMVFAVMLSFLLSKTLTNPIERLTKSAKRLADGDFDDMPTPESGDEIGVLTDTFNHMAVTLRDTIEEAEEERDKLSALFLHMADGVAAFDRNGRILHMNPAAEDMLGIAFHEDLTYDEVMNQVEKAEERDQDSNAGGVVYIRDEKSLRLFFAPFGSSSSADHERGMLVVIHDITQQAKLESARREFVANVSHELRTPLTSIKSYTETLIETPDLPPAMSQKFLGVIVNEADRMTRIVKDLLTLSRLDNGKFDLKLSVFDPKKLLNTVYDAMIFEAKGRRHTLTIELDENLPPLTADRERIEQVVVNIMSNAMKYTPNGGKVHLSGRVDGDFVEIAVQDNGVGIPDEDQPRLFERFYRVDKARSRDKGGTGLGLAIAAEIVRYHNGTIGVKSRLDEGTTVTVRLPIEGKKYEETA